MDTRKNFKWVLLLCIAGIALNMAGIAVVNGLSLTLYLDCIGTMLVAALGGYIPGIVVGLVSRVFMSYQDMVSMYYGTLNLLIAVCSTYFYKKGWLKKLWGIIAYTLSLTVIGGALGSVLTWYLYGFATEGISVGFAQRLYDNGKLGMLAAQFTADCSIDLLDKIICVIVMLILLRIIPDKVKKLFVYEGWKQTALNSSEKKRIRRIKSRKWSLRTKIIILITVALIVVTLAATWIGYLLYIDSNVEEHKKLAEGIANLAVSVVDGDRIDEYLELGEAADGYEETERLLYNMRDSYNIRKTAPDIEYIYVYKIMTDGCHVVFDLDTDGLEGAEPGEVIPFDDAFNEYIPSLLAGEEIEPIISDETYGWLLTVYRPIYDSNGVCRAYAAVDISMTQLRENGNSFLAKQITMYIGLFIVILVVGLWFASYNIIYPVNSMAEAAGNFAFSNEEEREDGDFKSVDSIKRLNINTGDEIENLYNAFTKMAEDSVKYVEDINEKTETLGQMQSGLIMVLADMVENRDENTGYHVQKTAVYTGIILEEMRAEGLYPDMLTDEYIENVVRSAPLHDVGKIKVPDAILGKPGKLTDEEFEWMKTHTTSGREIIDKAREMVPNSEYLNEARNLAEFHHEKWNGKGYPNGLSGTDIPLSARVMAVADVFDALVSKRCYKDAMPVEKAMDIIREGIGSHFDPDCANAFLRAEDKVRAVVEEYAKKEAEDEEKLKQEPRFGFL